MAYTTWPEREKKLGEERGKGVVGLPRDPPTSTNLINNDTVKIGKHTPIYFSVRTRYENG